MSDYTRDEILTLRSGAVWKVSSVNTVTEGDSPRVSVGLVNPENPNHGTAFFADVLDTIVIHRNAEPALADRMAMDLFSHGVVPVSWCRDLAAALISSGWTKQ